MKTYRGFTKREFLGEEFYAWCQQEFDAARRHLKTCGKPETEEDRWNIFYAKETVAFFSKFLD